MISKLAGYLLTGEGIKIDFKSSTYQKIGSLLGVNQFKNIFL